MSQPVHTLVITTSLALTLSACGSVPAARNAANDLPAFQQQRLAAEAVAVQTVTDLQLPLAPMQAAADNRTASLEPMVPRQPEPVAAAPKTVPAQPLIILRRTEPVVKPLTEEQLTNKLKDITAAGVAEAKLAAAQSAAEAKQTAAETAASMERLTLTELTRMRLETEHKLELIDKQSQIYAMNAADQKVGEVEARSRELAELRQFKADTKFDTLTAAADMKINKRLAEIRADEERKTLKPEDVKQIASATVEEAQPQMQALALKAVADSEDYIRTVARTAVKDKDPGMQTALKEAARDVIVKDNQIVFAIRKVVDQRIEKKNTEQARNGPFNPDGTRRIYDGKDISLDSKRLGVAQLREGDPFHPESIEPASGPHDVQDPQGKQMQWASNHRTSVMRGRHRQDWVDLRQYRVVLHEDNKTIEQLVNGVVVNAEPYVGPWEIKWKIKSENKDILAEKFSLDVETTFEEFVNYLANYMVNERGVKLSFNLFDSERVIVVSD